MRKEDYFKPLEECSKEHTEDEPSEYETMLAISRMPDEFTYEELCKEVNNVLLNRALSDLIDMGFVKAVWDEEQHIITFWSV